MRPMNGFHSSAAVASPPNATHRPTSLPHSALHSPVPYLFGGLAVMLGLIGLALLILACSYWKLSAYLDSEGDAAVGRGSGADPESAHTAAGVPVKRPPAFGESFVVIMAGDCKPTFLATPTAGVSSASSLAHRSDDAGDAAAVTDEKKTETAASSPPGDATQGRRSD
ncbi:protein GLUTAMINE DUMPER 3-like [Curcuma longa]|uniref:protein GLUTAMINE DUMPER 3-like n=1 Tax=Curcuma longa TaxID=136217 RepID=UPI003D9F69A9